MAPGASAGHRVQQRADIHQESHPERHHPRDSAPRYPHYPALGSGRRSQVGTDNPVLESGKHRFSRINLEHLPEHHQGRNQRESRSGHRYHGGQGIVLLVDRADMGGG